MIVKLLQGAYDRWVLANVGRWMDLTGSMGTLTKGRFFSTVAESSTPPSASECEVGIGTKDFCPGVFTSMLSLSDDLESFEVMEGQGVWGIQRRDGLCLEDS